MTKYCDSCEQPIDDWEAPDGYRYEGRTLCRFCYEEELHRGEEEGGDNA